MIRLTVLAGLMTCAMAYGAFAQTTLSRATENTLLHIIAHEIGHAVLREFDLPILGPEEAIAEDFATVYIHMMLPERAEQIVRDRARTHLADGDEPSIFSEYRSDAQRAGRALCLLYGIDPEAYQSLPKAFGFEDDADTCRDFGPEVARSWRRVLAPLLMPEGARVTETGVRADDTAITTALSSTDLPETALMLLSRIDWHSYVTLYLRDCDGGASWSRNGRTITICDALVARIEATAQ